MSEGEALLSKGQTRAEVKFHTQGGHRTKILGDSFIDESSQLPYRRAKDGTLGKQGGAWKEQGGGKVRGVRTKGEGSGVPGGARGTKIRKIWEGEKDEMKERKQNSPARKKMMRTSSIFGLVPSKREARENSGGHAGGPSKEGERRRGEGTFLVGYRGTFEGGWGIKTLTERKIGKAA